jgi:hypothetical protein
MYTLDFQKLYGGLDYRINNNQEQENQNMLFWTSSQNVEVVNGLLQPMNGNTPILTTPITGGILGLTEYEVEDAKYLMFTGGDGSFNMYTGNGLYSTKKSGLSTTAKCNYAQFLQKIVMCNGKDETFLYDKKTDTIIQTGIFSVRGINGQVVASFSSRLWIAEEANLYYSDLGDPTTWIDDPENNKFGGYINNFMANTDKITCMKPFGNYLVIYTSNHIYMLSGDNPSNFAIEKFGETGTSSSNGACIYDKKQFFFGNTNLSLSNLNTYGDMGQLSPSDSLTNRIHLGLSQTIDLTALSSLFVVPYVKKNQVWMYIKENNKDYLTTTYILDFNYMSSQIIPIYKRVGTPSTCVCNYNSLIYTGTYDGQIYQEDTGNTFNGRWFEFFWYSPYLNFGEKSIFKNIEFIKLFLNTTRENKFKFIANYQGISNYRVEQKINIKDNIFILGIDSLGGTKVLGYNMDLPSLRPLGIDFNSIQIGIEGTSVQNNFSLRMFSMINIQNLQVI